MAKDEAEKRVAPEEEAPIVVDEKQDEIVTDDVAEKVEAKDNTDTSAAVVLSDKRPIWERTWSWVVTHKKISIPSAAVVLLLLLAAIPFTRYALAGTVLTQRYTVKVIDAETKQPVSSAEVVLAGKKTTTDGRGQAVIEAPVGNATLSVAKKYYKTASQDVLVPIGKQKQVQQVRLTATGRQVPMVVTNSITKKPVAGAVLSVLDTKAKTDKQGKAILAVPADKSSLEVSVEANGYNLAKQTVQIAQGNPKETTVGLVPAGKIYFLSNKSGKIDVVKTNLDGSDRTVVLAGTGKEDRYNTSLLASRDWRYLVLHAKRDSDKAKLYLIDTATDKLTVMDEGDASFALAGWSNHRFIYTVTRNAVKEWQPKKYALKSFDATTQKLTTLDETATEGTQNNYLYENLSSVYILEDEIAYAKKWYSYNGWYSYPQVSTQNKQATLNVVKPDGKSKKVVKGYASLHNGNYASLELRSYGPEEIYLLYESGSTVLAFDEYEGGQVKAVTNGSREAFYNNPYPTYLISPSGKASFWTEGRDGKAVFFVGDKDGKNEKQLGSIKELGAYGWYTDDYLLASKNGSELYILPVGDVSDTSPKLKITDYYRTNIYDGYGRGYGGL